MTQPKLWREERQELNCRDSLTVGKEVCHTEDGMLMISFQNINRFGLDKEQVKDQRIYKFLKEKEIDMMGFAESNVF